MIPRPARGGGADAAPWAVALAPLIVASMALLQAAAVTRPVAERGTVTLDKPVNPLLLPLVPQLQFGFYRQLSAAVAREQLPAPSADRRDIAGRYTPQEATLLLPGERGRMASYSEAGARTFLARAQQVLAGRVRNDPLEQCKPEGPVRVLNDGFTVQVLQSPTQVVMIHMANHLVRRIRIGGGTATFAAATPSLTGTSIGHWEGNTLVIETRGIRDGSWLDEYGSPGGEQLMLSERYTKQPNGSLRLEATINDALNYLEPIRIARTWSWTPNVPWQERICEDRSRGAPAAPP